TNGTFVNGQRVKETELHDGDMVQVANVELVFYCGKSQGRQTMVTQVLSLDEDADADEACSDPASDLRRSVRCLHETLVSGCVKGRLMPIIDLRQGQLAGHEPLDEDVPSAGAENNPLLPAIPGRVAARLRHLRRMRGIEQAVTLPGKPLIFVSLQSAEVSSGQFLELASMFCELVSDPNRLVIAIPYAAAKEIVQALAPGGRLRELGAAVALSDLGGKDVGMALLEEIRPDFVRLAASLVRGVSGNPRNLRAIQAIIRAAGESGTKVIAAGISSPAERASCLEAGCELGQGTLFEERKRAEVPSRRASLGGTPAVQDAFYLSLGLESIEHS
ncbi:MAG: EAL domain-containing protein, partial [Thermoguttaceae bacterium]